MSRAGGGSPLRGVDAFALRRLHIYLDLLMVTAAWMAAYAVRQSGDEFFGRTLNPIENYVNAIPLVALSWVASCWVFGVYQRARLKTAVDQIQDLLKGVLLGLLVVSSIGFFFKELDFGRAVVVLTACFSLVFQGATRAFFHWVEGRLQASGRFDIPALILGAGTTGIRLLQKIQDHPEIGYRVVGFLDDDSQLEGEKVGSCPVLGPLDRLRAAIVEHEVREVFIATPGMGHTQMLAQVLDCEDLDVTFRVVTNLFEVLTAGSEVDLVDDLPLVKLGVRRVHALYGPAKRVFDFVGASLALVLAAPFWLWWVVRIRLDTPGPALFSQRRVGLDGREFDMLKFRTMHNDAEAYAVSPTDRDDPRITPYGRWLRRTSIDEVPNLLNVLRGEMSLVGPRPEMPFIVERYDDWQRRRLTVLPGITGLWQILGRKDLPLHDNLQYDFYYIRNRSLWLDLSILVRTAWAVLLRRGAF